jgi:hypothetical protein
MKCFRHHEIDALGICKNCSKGLCSDCLADLKDGIACKDTCTARVEAINALISSSVTQSRHVLLSLIYCMIGILFGITAYGNSAQGPGGYVFYVPAIIFFGIGVYFFLAPKLANKK